MKSASRMGAVRNARSHISRFVTIATVYLDVKAKSTGSGLPDAVRRGEVSPASRRPELWWAVDGRGSVWPCDGQSAMAGEVKLPSSLVHQVMMAAAERRQIVDIGQSLLQPVVGDVVDLGVFEGHVTQRTGAIHDPQGASLGAVCQACFASEVEPYAVGTNDDWGDRADARPAAHGLDW